MRIANITQDSIVDGPGLRVTVFTQGCPHHCPGCHNPETHDPRGGQERPLAELRALLTKNPLTEGLTLSGGEPFLQANACAALAQVAHEEGLTVWTYTGYRYEAILAAQNPDWSALLAETDVLVDGLFQEEEFTYDLLFRGSRNQRLIDVAESRKTGRVILWDKKAAPLPFTVPES